MRLDPFIEAEQATGHSVKRCCELFEVSRAAYYQRHTAEPSARDVADDELLGLITKPTPCRRGPTGRLGSIASSSIGA